MCYHRLVDSYLLLNDTDHAKNACFLISADNTINYSGRFLESAECIEYIAAYSNNPFYCGDIQGIVQYVYSDTSLSDGEKKNIVSNLNDIANNRCPAVVADTVNNRSKYKPCISSYIVIGLVVVSYGFKSGKMSPL